MSFIEPECPPLSQNYGRCGSSWGGRCNKNLADYAVYCNEDNGWCGVTSDHEHAQSSDIYDWEPESCERNNFSNFFYVEKILYKRNFNTGQLKVQYILYLSDCDCPHPWKHTGICKVGTGKCECTEAYRGADDCSECADG